MLESYRPLILLWAAILSLSAISVATLQILGPPTARGARHDEPRATSSPPTHADQPVAAASLPSPVAADPLAFEPLAPPVPVQPSHRRTRSWVRKGVAPARAQDGLGLSDDNVLAERGEPGTRSEPLPQDHGALPSPAAPILPSRALPYQHVAGYIGVFTMGADGTRVFRAAP